MKAMRIWFIVRNAVSDANSPTAHGTARIGIKAGTDVAIENNAFSFETLKITSSDTGFRKTMYFRARASLRSGCASMISQTTASGLLRRYTKLPAGCGMPSSTMWMTAAPGTEFGTATSITLAFPPGCARYAGAK
jgi:hypothetical protein